MIKVMILIFPSSISTPYLCSNLTSSPAYFFFVQLIRYDKDWKAYKAARNRVGQQINEAKRIFVNEAINQAHASPKNMWKRPRNSYRQNEPRRKLTCPSEIANKFNDFFSNIGHTFAAKYDNSLPTVKQLMSRDSFSIPLISEQFVIREVLSMSYSKSTGLDDISVKLLKLSIHAIGDIL